MTNNPYESPSLVASEPTVRPEGQQRIPPVGISLLVFLQLIVGCLLFVSQMLLFIRLQGMEQSVFTVGMPSVSELILKMVLAILLIAAAAGMWTGARWSWWLGAFYYVQVVFSSGYGLWSLLSMISHLPEGERIGFEFEMFKYGGRMVIHLLLFLYFFKGSVSEFFGLQSMNKAKAICLLAGTGLVLAFMGRML